MPGKKHANGPGPGAVDFLYRFPPSAVHWGTMQRNAASTRPATPHYALTVDGVYQTTLKGLEQAMPALGRLKAMFPLATIAATDTHCGTALVWRGADGYQG